MVLSFPVSIWDRKPDSLAQPSCAPRVMGRDQMGTEHTGRIGAGTWQNPLAIFPIREEGVDLVEREGSINGLFLNKYDIKDVG